jgi:putative PEP-CTERM system histidine kinase
MVGEAFRVIGPGWGAVAEVGLVVAGIAGIAISLTSGSARSRLRHLLVDNFYSHRYDYRKEWLQCIATLSVPADRSGPETRIIRALTAITDSPGGQLWMRDLEGSAFHWRGSWNLPPSSAAEPVDSEFTAAFRGGDWIIELAGQPQPPEWLREIKGAWLAVPLNHLGRLLGFVVLVTPRAPLRLDREVFDLLRIIARQAAGHAAERQYARAMLETAELRDFSKRFAFAVHDMKNVAAQLGMIVQNASRFRGDPEFHEDVLHTVEAARNRVNALIARLRSDRADATRAAGVSVPLDLIEQEVAAIRQGRGADIVLRHDGGRLAVPIDAEGLRNVIGHLCDNAIEASNGPVAVTVRHERSRLLIDIADSGAGMAAEFIRDRLFTPFGSTKCDGLGIGAYQARELLRNAGGDLLVQSRPGVGTTMRIILPCVAGEAELPSLASV